MNFVTFAELQRDSIEWSCRLPSDLAAVSGVPRSGTLPAAIIALHRNIPLIQIDELARGQPPDRPRRFFGNGFQGLTRDRILVIDDSANTGRTVSVLRQRIKHRTAVEYAALYYRPGIEKTLDYTYRPIELPRCFEWNLMHCDHLRQACVDIDGVLCHDPLPEENDDGALYAEFLQNARPRYIPSVPVHSLVTSRLERYRPETIDWLRRWRIEFRTLVMSPHRTQSERIRAADHAERKAFYYRSSNCKLFVESDDAQAATICRLTSKPVLCTDSMRLFC